MVTKFSLELVTSTQSHKNLKYTSILPSYLHLSLFSILYPSVCMIPFFLRSLPPYCGSSITHVTSRQVILLIIPVKKKIVPFSKIQSVQLTPLSTHWAPKKNKKKFQSFSDTLYYVVLSPS